MVRVSFAVLATAAVAFSLMLVAPGTANAVPGATYSYAQCHEKGKKGQGTMWNRRVVWDSYKCAKSSGYGWRLNVYGLSKIEAHSYFAGSRYSTTSQCESAGSKKRGTYSGTPVTWKKWFCRKDAYGRSQLFVDDLS